MRELIRNAANGWMEYTDAGKYAVLFLAVLLCYWYRRACINKTDAQSKEEVVQAKEADPVKRLMIYSSIMAAAAIVPVTAVLLMLYQTKFYDYKWVWSVVPVTAVIAYGASKLYLDHYRASLRGKWLKSAGIVAVGLVLSFLCGNLNTEGCQGRITAQERVKAENLLDKLTEYGNTKDICLWAPKEILTHIRGLSGEVRLLYGRNMWENALNAYAYDEYDGETVALYQWMEGVEQNLSVEAKEAALVAIATALDKGANCIVISTEAAGEAGSEKQGISACVFDVAEERNLTVIHDTAEGYDIYWLQS